jgi:uncharacterized protein YkwD
MTTREDRHRAPVALVLLIALAGLLVAAVAASPADARRPRAQQSEPRRQRDAPRARRVERRCTPAGINALRGTAKLERRVRCLVNRRRARSGMAPLRYNRCLDRAAERHVRDMVRRRYFAHSSLRGSTPAERARAAGYVPRSGGWAVAENLGWGLGAGALPHAIVRAWLRSPGHRANILQRSFEDVGVAVVPGSPFRTTVRRSGKAPATYVVEFGARQSGRRCAGRPRGRKPAAKQRTGRHSGKR